MPKRHAGSKQCEKLVKKQFLPIYLEHFQKEVGSRKQTNRIEVVCQ